MKQRLLQIYFQIFALLAKVYLKRHKPKVIWITWSIWKTWARMIISEILDKTLDDKVLYTSSKNYNWELWLSLSILKISDYAPNIKWIIKTLSRSLNKAFFWKKEYDIIFLEYWIDHVWEMDFLLSIVKPDISIVTKIDKVHSSQFKSKEIIASEKYKLSMNTKELSFLNYDCEFASKYKEDINSKIVFYSSNHLDNSDILDIKTTDYDLIKEDNKYLSKFGVLVSWENYNIKTNLLWVENLWYIAIWVYLSNYLNNKSLTKDNNFNLKLQPWRFSIFEWINSSVLVDSSYNAAPLSMQKSIENIYNVQKTLFWDYKIIFALWDMRELWDYEEAEHKKLKDILKDEFDALFLIWQATKNYLKPLFENKNVFHYEDSSELWEELKQYIQKDSASKYLVLFKWSQNTIFLEEAIKKVLLNESDKSNLCRQDEFWLSKKKVL